MVAHQKHKSHQSPLLITHESNGLLRARVSDAASRGLRRALSDQPFFETDETATIARAIVRVGDILGDFGIETLLRVAAGDLGEGVVLFENLPYEPIAWSPSPGMPARSAKTTFLSENLLFGFGGYMGEPYSVASEGDRLINELIPSRADLERLTGNGSRKTLGLHRENAAAQFLRPGLDLSPKALMLLCVSEQESSGPTTPVAIAARAVACLPEEDKDVLRTPCVYLRAPERWRQGGEVIETSPVPIIFGDKGREHIAAAFYGDLMRPVDDRAAQAVRKLSDALDAVAIPLKITQGTMVYLANGRTLHGRSEFAPEIDNAGRARRWLQRLFLSGRVEAMNRPVSGRERVYHLAIAARG